MSPLVAVPRDYHRFAGLIVLKAPDVPSVLLETGYITNTDDAELPVLARGPAADRARRARAVDAHFARRHGLALSGDRGHPSARRSRSALELGWLRRPR